MSRLLLTFLTVLSIAAKPPRFVPASESPSDEPQAAVASVLSAETESRQPLDRRALLQKVLEQSPDAASARWQAGYVRSGESWRRFEDNAETIQDDALRNEYRGLRKTAGQNTEDQLRLANRCKASGLVQQEAAHLTAALAFAGDRNLSHVHRRLGHRLVNGRWMTREEIAQAQRSAREMLRSMKVWAHRLQNIADRLAGSRRQRESAIADLQAIEDPAALPAVELVLAHAHEPAALQAVEWLAKVDRYQSSLALARQAAFSKWPSVREAATRVLKSRRWEDFMPRLLGAMHRPAESMFEVLIGPRGELYYEYLARREMAGHWEVARYNWAAFRWTKFRHGRTVIAVNAPIRSQLLDASSLTGPPPRVRSRRQNDQLRRTHDEIYRREKFLVGHNEHSEALNARIGTVLANSTGETFTSDPHEWWNWWINRLDVQPRPKRIVVVDEDLQFVPSRIRVASCLTAGTPVWTTAGAVPIEQIQIGDQVLSKDIETGELAWKPVVLTTRRQAPHIVRLTIATESLAITGGHLVWASGTGWTKARDLSPAHPLHTVTGTASVDAVEPVGSGTVYNLVVADFHTYFFGDAKILSHDTTIPKLTNVLVPGLPPGDSHPHSE